MDTKEYKFYLSHGSSSLLYKIVMIGFLCFAAFFVYEQLGITVTSTFIYAFILICTIILAYPLINSKKPLYIIDDIGITQNKYLFFPKNLPWSHIKSILYPTNALFGGKNAVYLEMQSSRSVIISLSDIDDPSAFLQALNNFKPFGYNQLQVQIYFQRHHDKERLLYITLMYLCIGISVLLMATFYMPYVWLEDNRYNTFWALLFFSHLLFFIVFSFFAYKDIHGKKTIIKTAIIFWVFIAIGPFIVEHNAYYDVRAIMAEKKGDHNSAEMYIRKAIEIHPDGYSYYETLGKILFHKGQFTECIDQFNFLLETDNRLTDFYKAYYHLWIGKALLRLDRIDVANEEFKKVKEFNIDDFNKELNTLMGHSIPN